MEHHQKKKKVYFGEHQSDALDMNIINESYLKQSQFVFRLTFTSLQ